jgi:hypothetical protein
MSIKSRRRSGVNPAAWRNYKLAVATTLSDVHDDECLALLSNPCFLGYTASHGSATPAILQESSTVSSETYSYDVGV